MDAEFLPWSEKYSLKIEKIDTQHKILLTIINDLYYSFIKNEHNEKIKEIISRLNLYAEVHFSTEEEYFIKFKYTESSEHNKMHQEFIKMINSLNHEYSWRKSQITYSLINYLRNWLTDHILIEDKKYVNCFIENGLK